MYGNWEPGKRMEQDRYAWLESQISTLKRLPDVTGAWGPGRPSDAVLKVARSLAETSWHDKLPLPSLIATGDRGVHVKWVCGARQVSAFIFPDKSVEYLSVEKGRPVSEEGLISDLLEWLVR